MSQKQWKITRRVYVFYFFQEDYDQKQEALEQEKLKRMVSCLSDEEKTVIYNKGLFRL